MGKQGRFILPPIGILNDYEFFHPSDRIYRDLQLCYMPLPMSLVKVKLTVVATNL
jgi:hypothetical protein